VNIHDAYKPFLTHFRTRRMKRFVFLFDLKATDRVIDVGGYEYNWTLTNTRPTIVLVNLEPVASTVGKITRVQGDGRHLVFPDNSFDIAYSNSVIEHVGGWRDQLDFAKEIARVAPRYYVQTPNKWFFVEPHLIAPFIHFFPTAVAIRLVRYLSVWGWVVKPDLQQTSECLAGISLLGIREMRQLFPDAEIHRERFFGMTKSIIAVRR
jgi:hypothetical protein